MTSENPPAFPSCDFYVPANTSYQDNTGMTLRDYFAAQIMPALLDCTESKGDVKDMPDYNKRIQALALTSYDLADAMLKARQTD